MTIIELLNSVKHANGIKSDGELARKLDVDKRRVSAYYKGDRIPDEYACLKIAEALGKPLDTIIATVKACSEKDEKRREVWENYMKRLGGIAASFATVFLACVTLIVSTPRAEAMPYQASQPVNSQHSLYYVKSVLEIKAQQDIAVHFHKFVTICCTKL